MTDFGTRVGMAKDIAEFNVKHREVPVGDQKKAFTGKDYRDLRRFFKHASSEEIRQWIVKAMYNNRMYTENQMKEYSETLNKELVKERSEASIIKRAMERYESEVLVYRAYLSLPWHKRLFTKTPKVDDTHM